jgi:hypothetical protein
MRQCKYCNKDFEEPKTYGKNKQFCSTHCKSIYGKKKIAEAMPERNCITCEKLYKPQWPSQVKFCCKSCDSKYSHAYIWSKKERTCIDCGEIYTSLRKDRKRCEVCHRKYRSKHSMVLKGKKNPNIKVGVGSGGNQWGEKNHQWNPLANKDKKFYTYSYRTYSLRYWGNCCRICGAHNRVRLHVHHIDRNPKNNWLGNIIPLCCPCHKKVHTQIQRIFIETGKTSVKINEDVLFDFWKDGRRKIAELSWNNLRNYLASQSEPKASRNISQGQRLETEAIKSV